MPGNKSRPSLESVEEKTVSDAASVSTHGNEDMLIQRIPTGQTSLEHQDGAPLESAVSYQSVPAQPSIPNGGTIAWLQVLAGFFMFFNSWYALHCQLYSELPLTNSQGLIERLRCLPIILHHHPHPRQQQQHRILDRLHPSFPHMLHHYLCRPSLRSRPRQIDCLFRLVHGRLRPDDGFARQLILPASSGTRLLHRHWRWMYLHRKRRYHPAILQHQAGFRHRHCRVREQSRRRSISDRIPRAATDGRIRMGNPDHGLHRTRHPLSPLRLHPSTRSPPPAQNHHRLLRLQRTALRPLLPRLLRRLHRPVRPVLLHYRIRRRCRPPHQTRILHAAHRLLRQHSRPHSSSLHRRHRRPAQRPSRLHSRCRYARLLLDPHPLHRRGLDHVVPPLWRFLRSVRVAAAFDCG